MNYKLQELVSMSKLKEMLDSLYEFTDIPISIFDNDNNILLYTGQSNVYRNFYEAKTAVSKGFVESHYKIIQNTIRSNNVSTYKYENGLVNIAAPITVDEKVVATILRGEFFLEKSDLENFKTRIYKLEGNEKNCMDALDKLPVIPAKKVELISDFLSKVSHIISNWATSELKQIKINKILNESYEELEDAYDQLMDLAYFDNITGLPNRKMLEGDLKQLCHNNNKFALFFLDVDNFKLINDTLGHDIGDLFLKKIGELLKNFENEYCKLYRWGGDEFVFILLDIQKVEKTLKDIMNRFNSKFIWVNNNQLFVTSSVGVVISTEGSDTPSTVLKNADSAMYLAKKNGKNNFAIYNKELSVQALKKIKLEKELRLAVENNNFIVYYQPQIDVKTKRIVGMEALVRWINTENQVVSPMEFIPISEETGLIVPIGEFVLRTACRQAKAWNENRKKPLKISVNLSAKQFEDKNLVSTVRSVLDETKLKPENLQLEITESVAIKDLNTTIETLKEFRKMNIKIALDDFGTGYSSIKYLQELPIDIIKLDKSFIDGYDNHKVNTIIKNFIVFTHELDLRVVAEGVETKEQLDNLIKHNCDVVQGYYYSKPVDAEEFKKIIDKYDKD